MLLPSRCRQQRLCLHHHHHHPPPLSPTTSTVYLRERLVIADLQPSRVQGRGSML